MRINVLIMILSIASLLLTACNGTNSKSPAPQNSSKNLPVKTETQAPATIEPVATPEPPVQTVVPATPEPTQTLEPTPSPVTKVLGQYSTKIVDKTPTRLGNLKIACKELNGSVIQPGEVFSFNETLGARTEEKGYQKGYVFEGKEKVEAIGGGICQVSSTLYNAVRAAGLEVTERHPHKRKVDYVKKGRDATVSYGELDFKFINNKDYAVRIEANLTATLVVVKICR